MPHRQVGIKEMIKTHLAFQADFPNDSVSAKEGNQIRAGGRELAEFLISNIKGRGYEVSSIDPNLFYGWEVTVELSSRGIWNLLYCKQ